MESDINPYKAPPESSSPRLQPTATKNADRWKFLLLGIAILASLTSLVPLIAAGLIVLSVPVFLMWYDLRLREKGVKERSTVLSWLARILGWVPLGLSMLAAAAAAFLGTCSVTAWSLELTDTGYWISDQITDDPMTFLFVDLGAGAAVGAVAFFTTLFWLRSRME